MRKKQAPKPAKMQKGFAVMKPSQVKRICSMGGKATVKRHGSKYMAFLGSKGGSSSGKPAA